MHTMFNLFKKLFGIPTPEDFAHRGQQFFEHLEKLDDSHLPLAAIRHALDDEAMGRLFRHAHNFPCPTDDELVAKWKSTAGCFSSYDFFVEYRVESAHEGYLVFDVLRKPTANPSSFVPSDSSAYVERGRIGDDGEPYNYFLINRQGDDGYALMYRIATKVTQGVLHIGTCRVFLGKRRQEALAEWDREMAKAALNKCIKKVEAQQAD